jgi:glutamyl-tRNA reductase
MTDRTLYAIVAHARDVPAVVRGELAERLRATRPPGSVLIETCHRVELYVSAAEAPDLGHHLPAGAELLFGQAVVEHAVSLAVGLRSAIVAEDQVLHQIREGVDAARDRGDVPADLNRLFDVALRAGRRGRSWFPARRPSLPALALDLVGEPLAGRCELVVGAGEMGRLAAMAAIARGAEISIASRTPERAAVLAAQLRVTTAQLDPGPGAASRFDGIMVAIRGPWLVGGETRVAIAGSPIWIVDLSAPPAVPSEFRHSPGRLFVSIDDLARQPEASAEDGLVARLKVLAEQTVRDYLTWQSAQSTRAIARGIAERAEELRSAELDELWRRLPSLPPQERREIEQMTRHFAERLLREPMEQLGRDRDGRHERAARELFGL